MRRRAPGCVSRRCRGGDSRRRYFFSYCRPSQRSAPCVDSRMARALSAASSVRTTCSSALSAKRVASAIVIGAPAAPVFTPASTSCIADHHMSSQAPTMCSSALSAKRVASAIVIGAPAAPVFTPASTSCRARHCLSCPVPTVQNLCSRVSSTDPKTPSCTFGQRAVNESMMLLWSRFLLSSATSCAMHQAQVMSCSKNRQSLSTSQLQGAGQERA